MDQNNGMNRKTCVCIRKIFKYFGYLSIVILVVACSGEEYAMLLCQECATSSYQFSEGIYAEEVIESPGIHLDENGVPFVNYTERGYLEDVGVFYNPVVVIFYGMELFTNYLKNNDASLLDQFYKQVEWLMNAGDIVPMSIGNVRLIRYTFDVPIVNANAPWISGMVQCGAPMMFSKAYELTGEQKYIDKAYEYYRGCIIETKDGGTLTKINDDAYIYEETTNQEAPSSKVLNGHIFALYGLYELWRVSGDQEVYDYLNKGINAVELLLPEYDGEFLSYYSLYPEYHYAPRSGYNIVHVRQLMWLYEITGKPIFEKYAARFLNYDKQLFTFRTIDSIDEVSHGPTCLLDPEWCYWDALVPATIVIDLKYARRLDSIWLLSWHSDDGVPRNMDISYSLDGANWMLLNSIRDNVEKRLRIDLDGLKVAYLKFDLYDAWDISAEYCANKYVALQGIELRETLDSDNPMILYNSKYSYAIGRPLEIIDKDNETSVPIEKLNGAIIDLNELKRVNGVEIDYAGDVGCAVKLTTLNNIGAISNNNCVQLNGAGTHYVPFYSDEKIQYLTLKFCDVACSGRISEIRIDSE